MATFPDISRSPGASGYSEELDKEGVLIGKKASGLPVVNELFTFVGITFKHTLFLVSQADKAEIMTFYRANRGIPFDWPNSQDSETYEVIFGAVPKVTMDKINGRWKMVFIFIQYSPL